MPEGQTSIVTCDSDKKVKEVESDEEVNINIEPVKSLQSLEQNVIFSEDEGEEWSQERLLDLIDNLYKDDKILKAARVLRQAMMKSTELSSQNLKQEHKRILRIADECERLVHTFDLDDDDTTQSADDDDTAQSAIDDSWICVSKRTKKLSKKDITGCTNLHYKSNRDHTELELRLETPIHDSLLVPVISVMNESQLYYTWLPSWKLPPIKFGIRSVVKLKQIGRCSQVIIVTFDLPWPLSPRQIVLEAIAADDIDDTGVIIIKLNSLDEGDLGGLVPPVEEDVTRLQMNGGFLIRRDPQNPKFILLQFYGHIRRSFPVPSWFVSFLVKTVVATTWNMFLNITKEVKDGTREKHAQVIREKWDDLYHWVETRAAAMLGI